LLTYGCNTEFSLNEQKFLSALQELKNLDKSTTNCRFAFFKAPIQYKKGCLPMMTKRQKFYFVIGLGTFIILVIATFVVSQTSWGQIYRIKRELLKLSNDIHEQNALEKIVTAFSLTGEQKYSQQISQKCEIPQVKISAQLANAKYFSRNGQSFEAGNALIKALELLWNLPQYSDRVQYFEKIIDAALEIPDPEFKRHVFERGSIMAPDNILKLYTHALISIINEAVDSSSARKLSLSAYENAVARIGKSQQMLSEIKLLAYLANNAERNGFPRIARNILNRIKQLIDTERYSWANPSIVSIAPIVADIDYLEEANSIITNAISDNEQIRYNMELKDSSLITIAESLSRMGNILEAIQLLDKNQIFYFFPHKRVLAYCSLSESAAKNGHVNDARVIIQLAIKDIKYLEDDFDKILCLVVCAKIKASIGETQTAFELLRKGLNIIQNFSDDKTADTIDGLSEIINAAFSLANNATTKTIFLESTEKTIQNIQNPFVRALCLIQLGQAAHKINDEKAKEWLKMSIQSAEMITNDQDRNAVYSSILDFAILYLVASKDTAAFKTVIDVFNQIKFASSHNKASTLINIINPALEMGATATGLLLINKAIQIALTIEPSVDRVKLQTSIFLAASKIPDGNKILSQIEQHIFQSINKLNRDQDEAVSISGFVQSISEMNNSEIASKMLEKALPIAEQIDNPYYQYRIFASFANAMSNLGHYDSAFHLLSKAAQRAANINFDFLFIPISSVLEPILYSATNLNNIEHTKNIFLTSISLITKTNHPYHQRRLIESFVIASLSISDTSLVSDLILQASQAATKIKEMEHKASALLFIAEKNFSLKNNYKDMDLWNQALTAIGKVKDEYYRIPLLSKLIKAALLMPEELENIAFFEKATQWWGNRNIDYYNKETELIFMLDSMLIHPELDPNRIVPNRIFDLMNKVNNRYLTPKFISHLAKWASELSQADVAYNVLENAVKLSNRLISNSEKDRALRAIIHYAQWLAEFRDSAFLAIALQATQYISETSSKLEALSSLSATINAFAANGLVDYKIDAIRMLKSCMENVGRINYPSIKVRTLIDITRLMEEYGLNEDAHEVLKEAILTTKNIKPQFRPYELQRLLEHIVDMPAVRFYHEIADNIYPYIDAVSNSESRAHLQSLLAKLLLKNGAKSEASVTLEKAFKSAVVIKSNLSKIYLFCLICETAAGLDDVETALKAYTEALKALNKINSEYDKTNSRFNILETGIKASYLSGDVIFLYTVFDMLNKMENDFSFYKAQTLHSYVKSIWETNKPVNDRVMLEKAINLAADISDVYFRDYFISGVVHIEAESASSMNNENALQGISERIDKIEVPEFKESAIEGIVKAAAEMGKWKQAYQLSNLNSSAKGKALALATILNVWAFR